jgi:hypothetical protein
VDTRRPRNLAELLLFPIPQGEHCSLTLAQALDDFPHLSDAFTCQDALFWGTFAIG